MNTSFNQRKSLMTRFPTSHSIVWIILIFCSISCSNSDRKFLNVDSDSWKSDTSGCTGYRVEYYKKLLMEKEVILGLNESKTKKLLGTPRQINLYTRGQKFFIYSIDCDEDSTQSKKLQIRFNAMGLASEILIVNK